MTADRRSDEDLLQAARRDPDAFAVLYDRHAEAIGRWLARRSRRDVADDLLAETFAQAWLSRRRFRPERAPARTWLFAIAQHCLWHYIRHHEVDRRARRRLGMTLPSATPTHADDADARLDAEALRGDLERRLEDLPAMTRDAVVLRVVEELEYEELAARLGCSNQTARARVSRGLRALRTTEVPLP